MTGDAFRARIALLPEPPSVEGGRWSEWRIYAPNDLGWNAYGLARRILFVGPYAANAEVWETDLARHDDLQLRSLALAKYEAAIASVNDLVEAVKRGEDVRQIGQYPR